MEELKMNNEIGEVLAIAEEDREYTERFINKENARNKAIIEEEDIF
jgi:hypothetical protein